MPDNAVSAPHCRNPCRAADKEQPVDISPKEAGGPNGLAGGETCPLQKFLSQFFELIDRDRQRQLFSLGVEMKGCKRPLRKLNFGPLRRAAETDPLYRGEYPYVGPTAAELRLDVRCQSLIPIKPSQFHVTIDCQRSHVSRRKLHNRNVKGSPTQIIDQQSQAFVGTSLRIEIAQFLAECHALLPWAH